MDSESLEKTAMNIRTNRSWLIKAFYFLCIISLFLILWVPEFSYYYVTPKHFDDQTIQQLRANPSQDVLKEINQYDLSLKHLTNDEKTRIAQEIIAGTFNLPNHPEIKIALPFSAADLRKGGPSFQLIMNELYIPAILLDAYHLTHNEKYFSAAFNYVIKWCQFESSTLLPKGFLWNDHAIAARVYVLSRIWEIYRTHPSFNPGDARILLTAVYRAAEMLAKPNHYTFRTNHGLMQNIALLHIAVAFPELDAKRYSTIALTRLTQQLKFYISDEGVVLEHSAYYHEVGVLLTGTALRYMTLLKLPIDKDIVEKYEKAKRFLANIKRPDNSLPMYGNTLNAANNKLLVTEVSNGVAAPLKITDSGIKPVPNTNYYPVSGYYVRWNVGDRPGNSVSSQAMVTWSNFDTKAHKHADEMSFLLWAGNQSWWTNVGYWPYGANHFKQAKSWGGSNAPHTARETFSSTRTTRVLGLGESKRYSIIDLQRNNKDLRIRRQVIDLASEAWVVLDVMENPDNTPLNETWTSFDNITMETLADKHAYLLKSSNNSLAMRVDFLGSDKMHVRPLFGSSSPFGGWIADKNKVQKAPAFFLTNSHNPWNAVVSRLVDDSDEPEASTKPKMLAWQSAEQWELAFPVKNTAYTLTRNGDALTVQSQSQSQNQSQNSRTDLQIKAQVNVADQIEGINKAYHHMHAVYGEFKDLLPYRIKISYTLLALFVIMEILFFISRRRVSATVMNRARMLLGVGWVLLGLWLAFVYLT